MVCCSSLRVVVIGGTTHSIDDKDKVDTWLGCVVVVVISDGSGGDD